MSYTSLTINSSLQHYIAEHSPAVADILLAHHQKTLELTGGDMVIPFEQVHFMTFLLKMNKAVSVLELGTFSGFSAMAFAMALPENGRVVTCDRSDKHIDIAKQYWQQAKMLHKIEFIKDDAAGCLSSLVDNKDSFDFIFIDADKKNLISHVEKALQLITAGGLIIVDNTDRKSVV